MIRLHGYWRSTASYRVRIALALKKLDHEQVTHDLRTGAQRAPDYLAINHQGLVPTLEVDGLLISQSIAILEWLDESYPSPALMPTAIADRALVRSMVGVVACDIHPLNNLRVLSALRKEFGASETQISDWISGWIHAGFDGLEPLVKRYGGQFAFGDAPTLVDCCLVPQLYSARRFGVDVSDYPAILERASRCDQVDAFVQAEPSRQLDAD